MMPEQVENRMAVGWQWPEEPPEAEEKLHSPGYKEIGTGTFVPEEDAFDYALEQCLEAVPAGIREAKWADEFREMLAEWFYSNWVKEG